VRSDPGVLDPNRPPGQAPVFIGRREELRHVRKLLATSRLVTLTGPGGVGKTRLALKAAELVRPAFPDGVYIAELAPVEDPALLVYAVGVAAGWQTQQRSPSAEDLAHYLADRHLLLVLDNCEHLIEACSALAAPLLRHAPDLRILATSRRSIGIPGEQIMIVPALTVPASDQSLTTADAAHYEAVALFLERARAARHDFALTADNQAHVARLCRQLEGLPLALELAAARLASLPVEQILHSLTDRTHINGSHTDRLPAPRHESLRSLIAWSFDLLDAPDRTLFTRLCVFPADGFDLAAAEEVCADAALPAQDVLPALLNLVDQSLVTYNPHADPGRYAILDTIRHFGLDRLTGTGELDLLRERHRDYYQQLATQAHDQWFGPRQLAWTHCFRVDQGNWRAALSNSLDLAADGDAALRIAGALVYYWRMTGMVSEGRQWLEKALAASPAPTAWRARALWCCGWFSLLQGDLDTAAGLCEEGESLARRLGEHGIAAEAVLVRGFLAHVQGDPARGNALMDQAEVSFRASGNVAFLALLINERSALRPGGDTAGLEEAARLCDAHGERWWRATIMRGLGWQAWRSGDPDRAITLIGESVDTNRVYGDKYDAAWDLLCLSVIATDAGRYRQGARLLGAGQGIMRDIGTESMMFDYPFHGPEIRRAIDRLRDVLGEDFSHTVDGGVKLPLTQAVSEARGEKDTPAAPGPAPARKRGAQTKGLTPRELEVAALVARGMTNRQIAAQLVISVRTAEGTVERIMAKLGLTSRTQVAAWTAEPAE